MRFWSVLFAIAVGGFAGLLAVVTRAHQFASLPHPERIYIVIALAGVVCLGLVCRRKWAALVFAGASGTAGIWLVIGSVVTVPFPYLLINMLFGGLLIGPFFVVHKYWGELVWRGRLGF